VRIIVPIAVVREFHKGERRRCSRTIPHAAGFSVAAFTAFLFSRL
jgi:hypothetical protein